MKKVIGILIILAAIGILGYFFAYSLTHVPVDFVFCTAGISTFSLSLLGFIELVRWVRKRF